MKPFDKEKRVIELVTDFMHAIEKCVDKADKMLETYLEADIESARELAEEVEHAEDEADECVAKIRELLYSGAYLPSIREDIFRVVQSLDKVANSAEAAAMHFSNQRPQIPPHFRDAFREVGAASFACVEPLARAVRSYFSPKDKVDKARKLIRETSHAESAVDNLEQKLTDAIFASDLELALKQHLRRTLHKIVRVSDRAEDASDDLELTVLKSII